MNDIIAQSRALANHDRANRVMNCAKRSVSVSEKVNDLLISVKLEAKEHNRFDFEYIKSQIKNIFLLELNDFSEIWTKMNELFVVLSQEYNDNKITVSVTNQDNQVFATSYYNFVPVQLIKI
jgi:hypothetical protein